MAVNIPVVIDIDQAFADAAKRVHTAISPLKQQIEGSVLDVKFHITLPTEKLEKFGKDFRLIAEDAEAGVSTIERSFAQLFKNGKPELSELSAAVGSFKQQLNALWNAGDQSSPTVHALQQAIILCQEYVSQRNRAVELTMQEYQQSLQAKRAEEERLFIIQKEAKTISELQAKLAALRGQLNNISTGGANNREWTKLGREIRRTTEELAKFEAKYNQVTTKPGSINRLSAEMSMLEQKWAAMSKAQKFDKDGNLKASAQKVVDKYRQLTDEAAKFGKSLEATVKSTSKETQKLKKDVQDVNTEVEKSNSRMATLIKNSLRLIALHTASSFIRNVREVTAEFELQKVALGSIIQDTEKAKSLFKQIKAAAVESPFEIKDLVTYTKQLSAYQIETEKLFGTTMKLADISAGLGVDMGRLILAFGQVRAAAVLRGQELRQFTEAGIPLVERLAKKFEELNGRAVTTAEVFELISKRAVPFSMIESIFDDMTSAGGSFYKMQEKQAETLLGQWNNLKDSISIMYDEIGNTSAVHGAMEAMIRDAKSLMQNWRQVATAIAVLGVQFGAMRIASKFIPNQVQDTKALRKAEQDLLKARALSIEGYKRNNSVMVIAGKTAQTYANYSIKAAKSVTAWGRAVNSLKGALAGNWLTLVLTAVSLLVTHLISARQEAGRLNKELAKIDAEGALKIEQSSRRFEQLAKTAVRAADGSKEQRDALEELSRAYGDILPPSDKLLEKLREMAGNYKSVTDAIREKISMQLKEQKVDEITTEFGPKLGKKKDAVKKYLKEQGFDAEEVSLILQGIEDAISDGTINIKDTTEKQAKAIETLIRDLTGRAVTVMDNLYGTVAGTNTSIYLGKKETGVTRMFTGLVKTLSAINEKTVEVENEMVQATGVLGVYSKEWRELKKAMSSYAGEGTSDFAKSEDRIRNYVEQSIAFLQEKFDDAKIDLSGAIVNGVPDFKAIDKALFSMTSGPFQASLRSVVNDFQKGYEKMAPSDTFTQAIKARMMEAADIYGVSMDRISSYIKKAGKDNKEWLQELKNGIESYRRSAQEMTSLMESSVLYRTEDNQKQVSEYNSIANALQYVFDAMSRIIHLDTGGATDKLDKLRNSISDITNAYKKYLELLKYMSKENALKNIDTLFPSLAGWEPTYEKMLERLENLITAYRGNADATRLIEQAIANVKFDKLQDDIKKELSELSNEIKRSKEAKSFYDNLLGLTGNEDLAREWAEKIYGDIGNEAEKYQKDLLSKLFTFDSSRVDVGDELQGIIAKAISEKDVVTLRKYLGDIVDANKSAAESIIAEWEKSDEGLLKNFAELISKYGDTAQKIATIRAKANVEIDKVKEALRISLENTKLTPEERKALQARAAEIIKALEGNRDLEEFKAGEEYIQFFSELNIMTAEQASTVRTKLRDAYLKAFRAGSISADELKRNLKAIDTQFRNLTQSSSLLMSYLQGGFDGANAKLQEYADNVAVLAQKMESGQELSEQEQNFANRMLSMFGGEDTKGAKNYTQLLEAFKDGGLKEAGQAFGKMGKGMSTMAAKGPGALAIVDAIFKNVHGAITGIQQVIDLLNEVRSEENEVGDWFRYVSDFDKYTFSGWEKLKSGDFLGATADAVSSWVSIFTNKQKGKVKDNNKQIKDQGKLLEDLEYAYTRLSVAIEKAFGSDYIANYNQQIAVLQAQAEAYRKQAELERKKGKSADENTARGYEKSAREVEDQIIDMRDKISEFFTGSDITSAAETLASVWREAYAEFSDTADAIREKMEDMIHNLIEKSAMAGIVQTVLRPWYDELNSLAPEEMDSGKIAELISNAYALIPTLNEGLSIATSNLEAAGVNMRQTAGKFSGISRDYATATEGAINGLAAGVNTQNFYISHVPQIAQDVALILAALNGSLGRAEAPSAGVAEPKYMSFLPEMHSDLHEIRLMLAKVISPNGVASNTHYVATR